MTYIVKDECIKCKLTDCVEVCPVDCFYEGENMLVINPDECIDCGVCEPECPIDAIKADVDESVEDKEKWLLLNKKFSAIWPNISKKKDPMPEHEKFKEIIISKIPSARLGDPNDVANAVLFLASDQSNYINGETIHVNGGMYMA